MALDVAGMPEPWSTTESSVVPGAGVVLPLAVSSAPDGFTEFWHPCPVNPKFAHGHGVASEPSPAHSCVNGSSANTMYVNVSSAVEISPAAPGAGPTVTVITSPVTSVKPLNGSIVLKMRPQSQP